MEIVVSGLAVIIAFTCLALIVKSDVMEMYRKRKTASIDSGTHTSESTLSKNSSAKS